MANAFNKESLAEWLLRWVADPVRASEFVGDQLEAHPQAGNLQFWMAIARVFLAFSWRTIVGTVASPVAGFIAAFGFFIFENPESKASLGLPVSSVIHVWLYLLGLSILFWTATVFLLVRFGWRSTLTGIGLAASLLCSASMSFFDRKISAIILILLWAAFLAFCMSSTPRRRALGILCSAVSVAWLTAFALSVIPHDPYSVFGKWQFPTAVVLVPIFESGTMLLLRRKFLV